MTGKLKNQFDLGFGQPKWFLSAEDQDDWQVKKPTWLRLRSTQGFLSAKVQEDWQVKKQKLDLGFDQPKGS